MSCICLHGDRRPQERKANLEAFKVNADLGKHSHKTLGKHSNKTLGKHSNKTLGKHSHNTLGKHLTRQSTFIEYCPCLCIAY